jgi:hypothetical protein
VKSINDFLAIDNSLENDVLVVEGLVRISVLETYRLHHVIACMLLSFERWVMGKRDFVVRRYTNLEA